MPHVQLFRICRGVLALPLLFCTGCAALTGQHSFSAVSLAIPEMTTAGRVLLVSDHQPTKREVLPSDPSAAHAIAAAPAPVAACTCPLHGPQAAPGIPVVNLAELTISEPDTQVAAQAARVTAAPVVAGGDAGVPSIPGYVKVAALNGAQQAQQVRPAVAVQSAPVGLLPIPGTAECGETVCPPHAVQSQEIAALTRRMLNLEATLQRSNESIGALKLALTDSSQDVRRLTSSVQHWQGEVQRLEATMKAQHESDIATLSRISELLETVIESDVADVSTEVLN